MIESQPSRPPRNATAPSAWRIRFSAERPQAARVLRVFTDPVAAFAVAESIGVREVEASRHEIPTVDQLQVVHLPDSKRADFAIADFIGANPAAAEMALKDGRLHWSPGRAVIEGNVGSIDDVLTAIAEFAFHEGQLRKLERELAPFELAAPGDVELAFRINPADQSHWPRLMRSMEQLARLRLLAARLEPRAYLPARDLPAPLRGIVSRLAARADIEDRLEAFSNRLEACEDLYEGATDRITDQKWARKGNKLEVAIVVLLLLEALLLVGELGINWLHPH